MKVGKRKRRPKLVLGTKKRLLSESEINDFKISLERLNNDVGKISFINIV